MPALNGQTLNRARCRVTRGANQINRRISGEDSPVTKERGNEGQLMIQFSDRYVSNKMTLLFMPQPVSVQPVSQGVTADAQQF